MITFDTPESAVINNDSGSTGDAYQEKGIIKDAFDAAKGAAANAAGINEDKVKAEWDNAKDLGDKTKVVRDTADKLIDAADETRKNIEKNNTVDGRSIVARARNSILQFPVYITQTTRATEAHLIAKTFERVYTTLVQTVLSQDASIDEKDANNLVFLKKYHTNIKEAADVLANAFYEPIDDIDRILKESVFYTQQLTENCSVTFNYLPVKDQSIIMENARLLNDPLAGFVYLAEAATPNGKDITTTNENINVKEDELIEIAKGRLDDADSKYLKKSKDDIEAEAERQYPMPSEPDPKAGKQAKNKYEADCRKCREDRNNMIREEYQKKKNAQNKLDEALAQVKNDIKAGKLESNSHGGYKYDAASGRFYKKKSVGTTKTTFNSRPVDVPTILKEADIKKINGMLPYTIQATFRMRTEAGIYQDVSYILGVKTVLHLIYAQDLADELHDLVTGDVRTLQKVRYKSGEINFMNYMFNINGLKKDAAKNINYNKKWINTLKRLAEFNRTHGTLLKKPTELLRNGNVPIPNGTLVLSQSDVTMLANQTGIDLSKVSNAKRLAKSLFLIAFVVVDSSAGTMRVLFPDSDDDWDVQSLASIDAEVSKTDNSKLMKELNKLVNN